MDDSGVKSSNIFRLSIWTLIIGLHSAFATGGLFAAENQEQLLILSTLADAIEDDNAPGLRKFTPVRRSRLYTLVEKVPELSQWAPYTADSNKILSDQIPAGPENVVVNVLPLEICGPNLERYGLSEENSTKYGTHVRWLARSLDRFRLYSAMENAGLFDANFDWIGAADELRFGDALTLNSIFYSAYQRGDVKQIYAVIDYTSGCGGGEVPVRIVADPPMDELYIIPEFFFSVCSKRFSDPWNIERCIYWDKAQEQAMASGVLRWQGRDPKTRKRKSGRINVDVGLSSEEVVLRLQ